ncbi:hypothetical protein [Pontibacter oryzae]|uniref:Uncharacterized protein n=1 Tax=Pontibacter oryzae TaxID=2304593 RepID=A0A399RT04_9BACT|nr:hypothetical protein [Pontibacter oryzae]RIJ34218.1 hypothetical protein D1627_14915 [Pontibacter oryzae]
MDIDKKLDSLKRIQPVDPPSFLYTRILARIESAGSLPAPFAWRWAFAAVFILLLSLNFSVLLKTSDNLTSPGIEEVVLAMDLTTSNDFYRE